MHDYAKEIINLLNSKEAEALIKNIVGDIEFFLEKNIKGISEDRINLCENLIINRLLSINFIKSLEKIDRDKVIETLDNDLQVLNLCIKMAVYEHLSLIDQHIRESGEESGIALH